MFQAVMAALLLLAGTCVAAIAWRIPDVLKEQMDKQHIVIPQMEGWTAEQIVQTLYGVMAGLILASGALLLILAIFVRRGGRGATFGSIVLNSLLALCLLLNLATTLAGTLANPIAGFVGLLLVGGMVTLCGATLIKLGAAYKAAGEHGMQAMRQAQYWQMMPPQQSIGYASGYPAPPPGDAPIGSPPPPPPSSNQPPQPPQ